MCSRLFYVILLAAALVPGRAVFGFEALSDPALIGWWTFDEGSGDVFRDSSPNHNDGHPFGGTPTWVAGKYGSAVHLVGPTLVEIPAINQTLTHATMAGWIKPDRAQPEWASIIMTRPTASGLNVLADYQIAYHWNDAANTWSYRGNVRIVNNEWSFAALTVTPSKAVIYLNGVPSATNTVAHSTANWNATIYLGGDGTSGFVDRRMVGALDDVSFFSRALNDDEILAIMAGASKPGPAGSPVPKSGATDVPRDVVLAWQAGKYAKTHDVYFGTAFEDVNTAGATVPAGVTVSRGQDAALYDPAGLLAYGQTYFWRVDEINAPPDSTVYKSQTWSFTAEPYGYPVTPAKVTASSSLSATMGPEKTIDRSGLDSLDQHGTSASQMWLSKKNVSPIWIQYELPAATKLYQMWVWNSNQTVEPDVGFGAKDVKVETSLDGTTWAAVAGATEFNQATGEPNYTANTVVDFGGAQAKYVKITVLSNWAGSTKQAGLAEVRFFYVPVKAFGPTPANAAGDIAVDATLNWRPGRLAAKHSVYVGADSAAVTAGTVPVQTVTDHTLQLAPLGLQYGKTYYWKVNEVNDAADPKVQEGDLWSFTTIAYAVVDDFESYNDVCNRIFFGWVDGFGYSASADCTVGAANGNGTGSTVGNLNAPFAEQGITHGGRQSMPMAYDNSKNPFYSEAQHDWATAQSWTGGGVDTLAVFVRGDAAAFLETSPGTILMNGIGTDIWNNADQFRFAYKSLKGNGSIVARVDKLARSNEWAKAGVMVRESMDSASTFAFVAVTPEVTHRVSFQHRDQTAGACAATDDGGRPIPQWVKLTRNGSTFTAQDSNDGVTWRDIAATPAVSITMANDVLIGLAVCSHDAAVLTGAGFSSVSTTGGVSGQWQVAEIGTAQPAGNAPDTFYVVVQDSSGKSKVVSNPDKTVIASGNWEQWNIPLSQISSASVNLGSIKRLTVGVGDRSAPKAGSAGKVYIDDIRLTRLAP